MTAPRHGFFTAFRKCRKPGEDGWHLERKTVRVCHDGTGWMVTFGPHDHTTWSKARVAGWSFELLAADDPTPESWGRARVNHGSLR